MSFTQTVLQHHRDCKVENTAAMPTLMGAADAADYFLCVVEALAEHLGGAEHRDKALRFSLWINACSCNASRWVRVV